MGECLGQIIGAFFVGIFFALGVLALIDLRWPKGRKAKRPSAHSLETNMHFQRLG